MQSYIEVDKEDLYTLKINCKGKRTVGKANKGINVEKNNNRFNGDSEQDDPQKKKCKKAKCLSEEALQIAVKGREVKSKGEKESYTHLNAEFQRIARRDRKPASAISAKK